MSTSPELRSTQPLPSQQDNKESMSNHDEKPNITVEQLADDGPRKPEWLCNISEEELAIRNKKLVRKMDMVIL